MRVDVGPTGSGKTTATAEEVAQDGSTVWLSSRIDDVLAVVRLIEQNGRRAAYRLPLEGHTDGQRNCLHPGIISKWQAKGYDYAKGYCASRCARRGEDCPFLESQKSLHTADTIVVTKALARSPGFFSDYGNPQRRRVVIDEDPIGLLRPAVTMTRNELEAYLDVLDDVLVVMSESGRHYGWAEADHWRKVAAWCVEQISSQPPARPPAPVDVPSWTRRPSATDEDEKRKRAAGRKDFEREFLRRMRDDPAGTVRNLRRDLNAMAKHADGKVFVSDEAVLFHVKVSIPASKEVTVLDATANVDLLRPLFHPRPLEVVFDERVEPAGRIIQVMDGNNPRQSTAAAGRKLVRLLDGIGDRHPDGQIVLISHMTAVEGLAQASKHRDRFITGHFGALRGRNDLEGHRVHIVVGSPKTNEADRQQLALAVYGEDILPFPAMKKIRHCVIGRELREFEDAPAMWEVRYAGYADTRMQAIYQHTVTAELSQAADRARVLIHSDAVVYVLTNEPLHKSLAWFTEMCLAADLLHLCGQSDRRSDYAGNYATYEVKAVELLNAAGASGRGVGNADICRALGKSPEWGKRYWREFRAAHEDRLEGGWKVRWMAL